MLRIIDTLAKWREIKKFSIWGGMRENGALCALEIISSGLQLDPAEITLFIRTRPEISHTNSYKKV